MDLYKNKDKSNIVVILTDEFNPFYTPMYGNNEVKTPNLKRLADMGTLYKNAYCPSPICLPCRSSFVSGLRVHEIQVYNNCNSGLNRQYESYGKVLNNHGVHSTYIGRLDAFDKGENLGFTEMINPGDRKEPGDTNFKRKPLALRKEGERVTAYGPKEGSGNGDIKQIDRAIQWINSTGTEIEKPWSLTVGVFKPHFPHYVPEKYWNMYPDGETLPKYGLEQQSANHPYAEDLRKHFNTAEFTEEHVKGNRRGYIAGITFLDEQIGRVIDTLEETGLIENTNIIVTADHGEMLGKFGMWWKCILYEDSVRIPIIAAGPDFKKGAIVETPVDLLDVQATIFRSTGAKRPEQWAGTPLQDIQEKDENRVVFSEYHGHGTRAGAFMVRKANWKLIYYIEGPHQLFFLGEDPNELNNVYNNYPEKVAELENELRKICSPEKENERAFEFENKQLEFIKKNFDL